MNKYFLSLTLASQAFFFGHSIAAVNPFAKLTPQIEHQAQAWTDKLVSSVSADLQLACLNFFGLQLDLMTKPSDETYAMLIKCAEFIAKDKDMLSLFVELDGNISGIIQEYDQSIKNKIANKTDKEKESILKKLEEKLQELMAYITAIYYHTLYGQASKTNKPLVYMFDENGIIPQGKRTKLLPANI